ncbi:MAG: DUF2183 domain-containing protein [Corallincola sp.]|nr:DUF2183 domain-containing protein [Corallincola sp.]
MGAAAGKEQDVGWRQSKRYRLGRKLVMSRGWRWLRLASSALLMLATLPGRLWADEIKDDELIQFYPSLARWVDDGRIELALDLWVYEQETRPGVNGLFARYLKVDIASLAPEQQQRYQQRTQLFRIDSERGKRVWVSFSSLQQANPAVFPTARTNANGRSQTPLLVDGASLFADPAVARQRPQQLTVRAVLAADDPRQFDGPLWLLPEQGLSVISDIDDTIKHSQVRDKQALLRNTFLEPFKPAPGMAAFYQRLASAEPAAAFHYVSSSPHQLYPPLAEFIRGSGFPPGTVHLRQIAVLDEIFGDNQSRLHKLSTIGAILQRFPARHFVLIGDSGEADPEIYGELARAHPGQIRAILIRDVSGQSAADERYQQAFAGLPPTLWQLFTDPATLNPHF